MKIEFNKIAKQIINNSQYNDNKSDKALLFDFGNTDFNYKGLEIESCGGGGRNKNSKGQTIYTYVVKSGDTLSEIAQKLCCTVDDLIEWNPANLGKNGEKTVIKSGMEISYVIKNKNKTSIKKETNKTKDGVYFHKVKKGETLRSIANKHECKIEDLIYWNPGDLGEKGEKTILYEGMDLAYRKDGSRTKVTNVKSFNYMTKSYVAMEGDSVSSICKKYKIPEKLFIELNKDRLTGDNYVKLNQKYLIPTNFNKALYIKRSDYIAKNANYDSKNITDDMNRALNASSFNENTTKEFFKRLAFKESSFDSTKSCGSFHGLYQMGGGACEDLGINTNDFLNRPAKQQQYLERYLKEYQSKYLKQKGAVKFIGTTVRMNIAKCGEPANYKTFKVTAAGLFAGSHLVGAGALNKSLTKKEAVYDGNGMPAAYYMWIMRDIESNELSELFY